MCLKKSGSSSKTSTWFQGNSENIGAKGTLGQVYLDLGLLHKAKGRMDQARVCISTSIELFEQGEAEGFLKQAKEALASLV